MVIDPTPVRDRSGPARPLNVARGRSKKALKAWLAAWGESWRKRFKVVAMDGFTGFSNTAREESPEDQKIMGPYHVVFLPARKVDECRRRIQQEITGQRGRQRNPLYRAQRTLPTCTGLLTDNQAEHLENLFADVRQASVEASWGTNRRLMRAYGAGGPRPGKVPDATAHLFPEAGRP